MLVFSLSRIILLILSHENCVYLFWSLDSVIIEAAMISTNFFCCLDTNVWGLNVSTMLFASSFIYNVYTISILIRYHHRTRWVCLFVAVVAIHFSRCLAYRNVDNCRYYFSQCAKHCIRMLWMNNNNNNNKKEKLYKIVNKKMKKR